VKPDKIKTGVMVKASYQSAMVSFTGLVVGIREIRDIFSEKYAIMETETLVDVLVEGTVRTFILEEDNVEVIYE
tara:strand:- start:277 stop:498 length:222 start_codon:yes stop_codon:yes gene_type:complete